MSAELIQIVGEENFRSDPETLAIYGRDWAKDFEARAAAVIFPHNEQQIVAIVEYCRSAKIALVPSGGRTGLSGGATALSGETILSLERMNTILELNEVDQTLRCQAGTITQRVQEAAANAGLYFPVDLASRGSSQIGGNVATNAGGVKVIRYGGTRSWVRGMRVVTGRGELLDLNGALIKNQTGYDLRSLFIGSEGTLGVITEVTLQLTSPPKRQSLYLCAFDERSAPTTLLAELRKIHRFVSLFEFFTVEGLKKVLHHHQLNDPFTRKSRYYLLIELEDGESATALQAEERLLEFVENGLVNDVIKAESSKQHNELMQLRELISETLSKHYSAHKNDISVPISAIPAFHADLDALMSREFPEYEYVVFGHIGDGNLHINVLKPASWSSSSFFPDMKRVDRAIFTLIAQHRGSISAEHGIGLLKRDFLGYSRSPEEIALMKGIKRSFDPDNILNPGKIFLPD